MNWLEKNYVTLIFVLASTIALTLIIIIFGVLPIQELNQNKSGLTVKDYFTLRNSIYSGLAQAIGGAVLLIGLFFTWKNIRATEKNLEITQDNMSKTYENTAKTIRLSEEGQITERFTHAIDQFGNQSSTIRLGGIYSLERIANDSEKDHRIVMEILSSFVRETAAWSDASETQTDYKVAPDVQAILTVIGRRNLDHAEGHIVNLGGCDLRSANFTLAKLHGVSFAGAHLERASFFGANLTNADLRNAYFANAKFMHAHLEETFLNNSDFKGAEFKHAHLTKADFSGACLDGATFEYSFLQKSQFSNAQLNGAMFQYSDLSGAVLYNSKLTRTGFVKTNMSNTVLIDANIESANLSLAEGLTLAQVKLAKNHTKSALPPDIASALLAERANDSEKE